MAHPALDLANAAEALEPAFDITVAVLDWMGVLVFAATGALAASRKQMDIVGFMLFGTVTGVGGGTMRDLVLGQPVFWTTHPEYLAVCLVTAAAVFVIAPFLKRRYGWLLWLDALGLAFFAVVGAEKGLLAGAHPLVAVTVGMMTATFGGIVRDVIAEEPSVVLKPEIYVTAAVAAAAVFVLLMLLGVRNEAAVIAGVLAGVFTRGGALLWGWTLPRYRARPGRERP